MNIHLCFHGVGKCVSEREPGESDYWVTEELFQRILDEVQAFPDVQLSFDDGNRSDIEVALPELQLRGLHATFFALAGRLDDPASLAASDLRALRAAGMAIGSHGWAHVPWRGLTEPSADRELVEARKALEEASDGAISDAALPLGRYDRQLLQRLKKVGYRTVFTSDRFPARPGSWLQARYSVRAGDTVESVRAILGHKPGVKDVENLAKSLVKRIR